MPNPLARPSWRGRTNVDAITIAAIEYAESLRHPPGEFTITQGSYQGGGGDVNSAGTHDLGGVVDIRWTGEARDVWCLRMAGFAAWHRTQLQGPWPDHVHAVLVDHPKLAASAARQVDSYRAGRNGLVNNGPDDGPKIRPIPVFAWPPKEEDDMASPEVQKQLDRIENKLVRLLEGSKARQQRLITALDDLADEKDVTALKNRIKALRADIAKSENEGDE